jgi:Flp pilus assembly protein TadG
MKEHMMIKQQDFRAKFRSRQHGAVAIIVAISLVVLIGILGLVLDLGRLYVAKTDLQNAADAAALSGAKQLDGTSEGICCDPDSAVGMAIETASLNSFYSNTGKDEVTISENDIEFADTKDGEWVDVDDAMADPVNKFFIRVNTASGNLSTWFIHVIPGTANTTSTNSVAVAGSFPPGALTPMFVPVVRRNSDQRDADVNHPNCSGYIYDPANKKFDFKKECPTPTVNTDPTDYRNIDFSGNWGFLKANECKQYTATSTTTVSCDTTGSGIEKGSYYVITPQASTKWDSNATQWVSAAAWTGNFGFMLKDSSAQPQKVLWEAMCTGGSVTQYPVPGCGLVHTGGLSGPAITDNLNTRFDVKDSNQTALSHEFCPSDTNISTSSTWQESGFYAGYVAGSPMTPPTLYPPGKPNRRVIRVYVVDNAWLAGYNIAGGNDDSCYADSLTGSSNPAHLVGCAEFFMWKSADSNGKLYAEYVRAIPANECNNSPASNTAIRLYH